MVLSVEPVDLITISIVTSVFSPCSAIMYDNRKIQIPQAFSSHYTRLMKLNAIIDIKKDLITISFFHFFFYVVIL